MNADMRFQTIFIFLLFALCYLIVAGNLFFIQLINSHFFTTLGAQQYAITINQLPPRGLILDRTGHYAFALNKACISAFVIPQKMAENSELLTFLKHNFPGSYERIVTKPKSAFCYIKRRLSPQELDLIAQAHLPDIHLLHETSRFYSMPSAAPLIGFTDIDNAGLAGIELVFNDLLTGTPTQMTLDKDARSGYFYFDKKIDQIGTESMPIQLTIDANLQFLVDEQLADAMATYKPQEASAIIMDPCTGEILALASHPFSDPNSGSCNQEFFKQRAITENYELGSVIKIAAALAAIEEGVVTPDELIDCKNKKTCIIDGRVINTVTPNGVIPFHDVIAYSNNIGIAQVAKRVSKRLYDHYANFGFGQKTGIPLPAESKGFINHPDNWSAQSVISLSYGYEISATLLQLACFFSMIACDGKKVIPHLIMGDTHINATTQCCKPASIAIIKDMLKKTAEYGTGKKSQLNGFTVMSKTGTANMLINGAYDQERHLLSCAGIIEKGNYKRVIVVFIKDPAVVNAYAATIAAPLFRKIAQNMVIHEGVA